MVGALASCHKDSIYAEELFYFIDFSFKDQYGNDLVAPLVAFEELNSDKYVLEAVLNCKNESFVCPSSFIVTQNGNYRCLCCQLRTPAKDFGLQNSITYKLSYPDLFGDEITYEIVTYWDFSYADKHPPLNVLKYPECYGAVFNNQRIIPVISKAGNYYHYYVDIVLDR